MFFFCFVNFPPCLSLSLSGEWASKSGPGIKDLKWPDVQVRFFDRSFSTRAPRLRSFSPQHEMALASSASAPGGQDVRYVHLFGDYCFATGRVPGWPVLVLDSDCQGAWGGFLLDTALSWPRRSWYFPLRRAHLHRSKQQARLIHLAYTLINSDST